MANSDQENSGKGRLSDEDAARLAEQVAGLAASGLPLAPGLRASAEELPRGRLRAALEDLATTLDLGVSIDGALAARGDRLPGYLRGLIRVGSRSGRSSEILGQFVAFHNVGDALRRQLWISMAYPLLTIAIAFAVFVYVCSVLVQSFEVTFRDFGIQVPPVTMVLIALAQIFALNAHSFVEVAIGAAIVSVLFIVFVGVPMRRRVLSAVPLIGVVWWNTALAEFCHLLALLLDSEIPLGEAVRLSGDGVRNATVDHAAHAIAGDVEGGQSFREAVARRRLFPKGMDAMFGWAEEHQSLPDALRMAGAMFEARAQTQAGLAGSAVAMMTMFLIVFGVWLVIAGLLAPMITVITRLSG